MRPDLKTTMHAIDMVGAERIRQITAEGFTTDHDDQHADGVLARAGACYAMNAGKAAQYEERHEIRMLPADYARSPMPAEWPWALDWWKPKTQMQDLLRAAALILAEIERRLRQEPVSTASDLPDPPSPTEVVALIGDRAFAFEPDVMKMYFATGRLPRVDLGDAADRRFMLIDTAPPCSAFASPPDRRFMQPMLNAEAYTSDRRFAQTSEARAIIEGAPSDKRASLAEACAKAGFACRFLPERLAGSAHIWLTLAAPPNIDLSGGMDAIEAQTGMKLLGRHPIKDMADPALCAGVSHGISSAAYDAAEVV